MSTPGRQAKIASEEHSTGEWILLGPTIRANGYNIGSVNSHRTSEGRANGRLIIAAPRMLAELNAIYAELDDIYDVDEESGTGKLTEYPYAGVGRRMQQIEAIIRLAEGAKR